MTSRVSDGLVFAYSPVPSVQAPLMKLPKILGLSIVLLARGMIAVPEPKMRRGCPIEVKILAALVLALGASGAFAQSDPAVQEPKVAPIRTEDMKPGYGVVESVTEVELVRERQQESRDRSAAAGGAAPGAPSGPPLYRGGVRMPDGSLPLRDLDKPEFKGGDNRLPTNPRDTLPD